jgi:ribosomal subunit interface protein
MQTEPQVTFKGIEKSPALDDLIHERISSLERFHPAIISCRVVVDVPHRAPGTVKVPLTVAVEVQVPGRNTVVAKDSSERHEAKEDHTAALNKAFDAVERQLVKLAELERDADLHNTGASPEAGVITRLFSAQGYGFVQIGDAAELYFTANAVSGPFDQLTQGMMVHVVRASEEGPMGPQASSVSV